MLQTECGYTPMEISAMTLHDIRRLNSHWQRMPPLRVLVMGVAHALGIKFDIKPSSAEAEQRQRQYMTADDAKRMIAITGGRVEGAERM